MLSDYSRWTLSLLVAGFAASYGAECRSDGFSELGSSDVAYIAVAKEDYVPILRMMEASIHANVDKIKRWSGSYEMTELQRASPGRSSVEPEEGVMPPSGFGKEELSEEERGQQTKDEKWLASVSDDERHLRGSFGIILSRAAIEFASDIEGDRLYCDFNMKSQRRFKSVDDKSPVISDECMLIKHRHILVDGEWRWHDFNAFAATTEDLRAEMAKRVMVGYRDFSEQAQFEHDFRSVFRPERLFSFCGVSFHGMHKTCAAAIENNEEIYLTITSSKSTAGTLFRLRKEYKRTSEEIAKLITEAVFDSSVDFNPVLYVQYKGGAAKDVCRWTYRRDDGILIPSRFIWNRFDDGGGPWKYRREVALMNSSVNTAMDDGQFSWEVLGFKNGDQIDDRVENRRLLYKDGQLSDISDSPIPKGNPFEAVALKNALFEEQSHNSRDRILMGFTVLMVTVIAFMVLRGRRRRP